MTEAALTIPFTGTGGLSSRASRIFVHLQQVEENLQQQSVTAYDIQQMVARARGGLSARTYKAPSCAAYIEGGTLVANFDFYAWPSSPDLVYAVTCGLGNITEPIVVQVPVQFSVTFELSDIVEFDFMLEEVTDFTWETDCYDSQGRVVDGVTVEMDGLTTLRASVPVFGVVRINAIKRGGLHTLTTRLVKTMQVPPTEEEYSDSDAGRYMTYSDFMGMYFNYSKIDRWNDGSRDREVPPEPINYTGLKLTNLKISVTAHWMEGVDEKTDQIMLEVPGCIKDLLEACGVDTNGDGIIDNWDGLEDALLGDDQEFCGGSGDDAPWNVYVSGCTGKEIMAVRQDQDENSWCGK